MNRAGQGNLARNIIQGPGTAKDQSCQVLNYQASCGGHKPGEHNVKALVGRIKFEINSFMIDGTKSTFKNLESLLASSDVFGFV